MSTERTVWGIDVGASALKAVKLRDAAGCLCLDAFDVVEHSQAPPAADAARRRRVLGETLHRFLARADLSGCHVVVSVSGRGGWSRFAHLAPVESSRVPEVVRFEAAQQAPLPLGEVIWRWQTFRDPDDPAAPDVDAGIFAVRRFDVGERLLLFSEAQVGLDALQMAPLALYNFLAFEELLAGDGATLLVDAGAEETDLVVADGRRIWTRCVAPGGGRVGEDLSREVRQAMVDYTAQQHPVEFRRLVAVGGAFGLPGLAEALEASVGVPVVRVGEFRKVAPGPAVDASALRENVPALAVAYGLAIQGLGLTPVHVDFLPAGIRGKLDWLPTRGLRTIGRLAGRLLRRLRAARKPPA